jgi:hypothetical protein
MIGDVVDTLYLLGAWRVVEVVETVESVQAVDGKP